jgi:hypothetical protein
MLGAVLVANLWCSGMVEQAATTREVFRLLVCSLLLPCATRWHAL